MLLRTRLVALLALTGLFVGGAARGHNLFVLLERSADGPEKVNVIFEHFPYPGNGGYNQPHLERGTIWVQPLGSKSKLPLRLSKATRLKKKYMQATVTGETPRAIVHTCKWGVYKGRLDFFHGKYLDAATSAQLAKMARTPELPLDLAPAKENDALTVRALFKNKPLAKTRIWIWAPGSKERSTRADARGVVTIKNPKKGTYSFAVLHTLKDPSGTFDGKDYKGVMHGTTCSLRWPVR